MMLTQFPPAAHFKHPQFGTYRSADELLTDDRLSETQKQMTLEIWRSQLEHGIVGEAEMTEFRAAVQSLKGAAARLAAGGH